MRISLLLAVMCVLAGLGSGCADELTAADIAKLPRSVDVRRLDGAKLEGGACTFRYPGRVNLPGSGQSVVSVVCSPSGGRHGSASVTVTRALTGEEPAEDSLQCHEERSAQICVLRHGNVTIESAAGCEHGSCNAAEESRGLVAQVADRLMALPQERCRLCARPYSPERVEELTQTITGRGREGLGTINVKVESTIEVWPRRVTRVSFGRPSRALVDPTRHRPPFIDVPRGSYRHVIVSAPRRWYLYIRPQ